MATRTLKCVYVKKEEEEKRLFLKLLVQLEEANLVFLGSCSNFNLQIGFLNGFLKEHQAEEGEHRRKFMFSTFVLFWFIKHENK